MFDSVSVGPLGVRTSPKPVNLQDGPAKLPSTTSAQENVKHSMIDTCISIINASQGLINTNRRIYPSRNPEVSKTYILHNKLHHSLRALTFVEATPSRHWIYHCRSVIYATQRSFTPHTNKVDYLIATSSIHCVNPLFRTTRAVRITPSFTSFYGLIVYPRRKKERVFQENNLAAANSLRPAQI